MSLLQIHEPGQTPTPHANTAAVGIDLGTTHSLVAIAHDGTPEILHNIHGHALVPSVVYYGLQGEIEVGYPARARLLRGEAGVVASIKRKMGEAATPIDIGGTPRTPVEISADILRELKRNAERALGKEVTKAVITVPAYFDDTARAATKDAATLAGLEVLRLINEPTSAALAYGLDNASEGLYAIYDLGGGTFDISILKLEGGVFQVLATGGDTGLGGDDFDDQIAGWFIGQVGIEQSALTPESVAQLVAIARDAKHALTTELHTDITFFGKTARLTRVDFDTLINDEVERTLSICASALEDAKLKTASIKGVVMVGGSTRVRLVIERVTAFFGQEPLTNVNPDEVVALGAAIQAEALTHGGDHLLLDVIPLSLGLETMGNIFEKIIDRNTPIPVSAQQEFTTYQDNQTGMVIHVLQGEREMVGDNRSLARFELAGIPPMPAGQARVTVTFTVDADGLLTVSASEKTTQKLQSIHVKPSYGLSHEQMGQMLLDSQKHARADITKRLLAEAKTEAKRAIIELKSAIHQDPDLLTPGERHAINQQITALEAATYGDDRDRIDAEVQHLSHLAAAFAQRRMDSAIAKALKGANIDHVIPAQAGIQSK